MNEDRRRRRALVAVVAGVSVFGIVGASAASLGGITSGGFGSDSGVVASCDSDGVDINYVNTYNDKSGVYETTAVSIAKIDKACDTFKLSITLKDEGNAKLADGSVEVTGESVNVNLASPVEASKVAGVAIIIEG